MDFIKVCESDINSKRLKKTFNLWFHPLLENIDGLVNLDLLLLVYLGSVEYRRAGHPVRVQSLQPLRGTTLGKHLGRHRKALLDVDHPTVGRIEALVV